MLDVATASSPEDRRSMVAEIAAINAPLHVSGREVANLVTQSVVSQYDRVLPLESTRSWARRHTVCTAAWLNQGLVAATELEGHLVALNQSRIPLAEPVSLVHRLPELRLQSAKLDLLLRDLDVVIELGLSDLQLKFVRGVVTGKKIVVAGAELGMTPQRAKGLWLELTLEVARSLLQQCSTDPQLIYTDLVLDLRTASRTLGQLFLLKRTSVTGMLRPIL